jgi:hypothetical protein
MAFTMVGSAASTTKALSTNYTLVNMGTQPADVIAGYYKSDGTSWAADPAKTSYNVAPNYGQMVVAQYFDQTMIAGRGSAVISSSQPLGAVVTIQARNQTPTNGAYIGFSKTSNQYYVPLVLRKRATQNGVSNTQIMIQNIQSAPITASVQFVASPGSGFSNFLKSSIAIPAFSTFYYDVEEESATNLPDAWIGSAVVTAETGKQIAVIVNVFTGPDGLQTLNAFPAEMATTSWAVPQFASRLPNGFNTPINVQNVSGGNIAVGGIALSCKPAAGFTGDVNMSNTIAVPANATYGFNPVSDTSFPTNWQGACIITAPGNIVAFITLRRPGVTAEISAYEAFRADSTDTKVVIPLMAKRLGNGFSTASVIMNLDPVNVAKVHLTYTRAAGITVGNATYTLDLTIPAGGNITQNLRLTSDPVGLSMPDGWQGTLVVETQAGQTARPIVAYVALTNIYTTNGDTQMAHDAFTQP